MGFSDGFASWIIVAANDTQRTHLFLRVWSFVNSEDRNGELSTATDKQWRSNHECVNDDLTWTDSKLFHQSCVCHESVVSDVWSSLTKEPRLPHCSKRDRFIGKAGYTTFCWDWEAKNKNKECKKQKTGKKRKKEKKQKIENRKQRDWNTLAIEIARMFPMPSRIQY